MSHDVFISYSSYDKSVADAICAKLEAERIRCWIAPRDVLPGVPYAEALIEAINGARMFALVLSGHSNTSPQVLREVERGVHRGLPIIPFRIEDVPLSKAMEYFVSASHWLDALTPPLEMHIVKLSETVQTLLSVDSQRDNTSYAEKQTSRKYSVSDEETLKALYVCFDRPAFQRSFENETGFEYLMIAIDDTIAAINTGITKRRDGIVFGQPVKGKAYFDSDDLRDYFDKIVRLLTEVKFIYEQAVRSGYFFEQSGRVLAFHRDHTSEAVVVAVKIDELRNEVLVITNSVYEPLGMRPFPYIETPQHYLDHVKALQPARESSKKW